MRLSYGDRPLVQDLCGLGCDAAPKMPLEAPARPQTSPRNAHRICHTDILSLCPDCAYRDTRSANKDNEGYIDNGTQDKGRDSGPPKTYRVTSTSHGPGSPKDMESRRRKIRRVTLPPHLALIGIATASACIMGRYHQVLEDAEPFTSWLLLQLLFTKASSWMGLAETVKRPEKLRKLLISDISPQIQHVLDDYRPTPFVFVASCLYFGLTLANVYEQLKGRPKHGRNLIILWCGLLASALYGLWLGRSGQEVVLAFAPWGLILASTACVMLHPFEEVSLPQNEN